MVDPQDSLRILVFMASHLSKIEAVAIVALVLLLVLLSFLGGAAIAQAGESYTTYGNDFTVFYAAAHNLVTTGDPYHHPIAAQTPYLYLPLFALLITPLTSLSLSQAALVWYGLNLLMIVALILITAKIVGETRSEQAFIVLMLVAIATRLIIDNLFWGQVNILVALLISGWLWAWQRQAWGAELLLALAISIKITPALLVLYLIVSCEGRALLRLAVSLIVLNGISLIPLGQQAPVLLQGWFQRTILNGEGFSWAYAGNQSLRGAISRFFTDTPTGASYYPKVAYFHLSADWATSLFLLIGLTLLLSWLYQAYQLADNKQAKINLTAAGCCLMLLLSNLSWKAHFIMLMLPWAVLARQIMVGKTAWLRSFALGLAMGTLLIMVGTVVPVIGLPKQQWFEVHSYYCLLTLLNFYLIMKDISYNKASG